MECSFFENLNQRKLVTSGGFPDTIFFIAFAEMFKQFWLLHCLGFSMHVSIFQAKKDCSFLEIYMENVIEESLLSGEINNGNVDVRVSFMVVPRFEIGAILMGNELVVEDGRVNFDFDEVDGYGGNLGDHDAAEGPRSEGSKNRIRVTIDSNNDSNRVRVNVFEDKLVSRFPNDLESACDQSVESLRLLGGDIIVFEPLEDQIGKITNI
ncbi:hypothetical protein GOBAR_DD31421 [Gossypium barbadense]|nr:hypothetical protein GOBAR_DD31421 [Gossypium barbadense]